MELFYFVLVLLQAMLITVFSFHACCGKVRRQPVIAGMVLCASLVYSFFVFLLAKQAALFVPDCYFSAAVFLFQTGFYFASIYFFWSFLHGAFLFIIDHTVKRTQKLFLLASVCWLVFLFAAELPFRTGESRGVQFFTSFPAGGGMVLSCVVFYRLAKAERSAERFKQKSEIDVTTGLNNKNSFYDDLEIIMELNEPFSIYFMDLDNFKSINDLFGHSMGDEYLKVFSDRAGKALNGLGRLYRISGDEFIFLHLGGEKEEIRRKIDGMNEVKELVCGIHRFPFFGVSYGISTYPCDAIGLKELLSGADKRMYQQKTIRKENGAVV